MERYIVIDADGHVEPALGADWLRFAKEPYGSWLVDKGRRIFDQEGDRAATRRGAWDPQARLEDMDSEGIDIAVLFGGNMGLSTQMADNAEYAVAYARAYNDWLADYCSADSDRLKGVAMVPVDYPELAAEELRRAVTELGAVAVVVQPFYKNINLYEQHFFPIYEAAQEVDVPVMISHIYATQNADTIHVTATDVRGEVSTADFTVVITFPTAGLMAFYPMNDLSTVNNVVRDLSPAARNGTRPIIYTFDHNSRFGTISSAFCLSQEQVLNGNEYAGADLPPMPVPGAGNGMTLAAWIIPHGDWAGMVVGQEGFTALYGETSGGSRLSFTIRDPSGAYHTLQDTGAALPTQTGGIMGCGTSAVATNWTFYAATVRREGAGSRIRLYRGEGANLGVPSMSAVQQIAELVLPNTVFSNPNGASDWQIVREHDLFGPVPAAIGTGGNPFQGRVDDVRIYDRALVLVELDAVFNEADNSSLPGNLTGGGGGMNESSALQSPSNGP